MRSYPWLILVASVVSAACATAPADVGRLDWVDALGNRDRQVSERDHRWCARLVENHRSQLSSCMLQRGWRLR
jgi:hypothetical protein